MVVWLKCRETRDVRVYPITPKGIEFPSGEVRFLHCSSCLRFGQDLGTAIKGIICFRSRFQLDASSDSLAFGPRRCAGAGDHALLGHATIVYANFMAGLGVHDPLHSSWPAGDVK